MKYLLLVFALAVSASAIARDVEVEGHFRRDGTYVQPHHRTAPDHNQQNNYGTQGNYNPYTGQEGRVQPQPSYQPYTPPPSYQPYQAPKQPCYGYGCR